MSKTKADSAKRSVLSDFYELLAHTEDFSGFPELQKYYDYASDSSLSNKNSLILFSLYRLSRNLDNKKLKNFECDCCEGVTDLYKLVYNWLKDFTCEPLSKTSVNYQLCHSNKNIFFKGDTMTSVFTPLKEYIKSKREIKCTSSKTEDWEEYWMKNIQTIDLSEPAYNFIWSACSFANFIPVPQGFNTGRSNFGKWDSWDLTLNQIYQWYLDNPQINDSSNDCALENLFKYSKSQTETIACCKEWLKMFDSWDDFVEQNYMQAFLLPDGSPKKFFENHALEYGLPKTLDEYEEFFENAVSCIEERGNAMNRALNIE